MASCTRRSTTDLVGNHNPTEKTNQLEASSSAAPATNGPPDVDQLAQAIIEEVQGSRKQRVDWIHQQAQEFVKWGHWRRERIQEANATIRRLKDAGWKDQAGQIEAKLYSNRDFSHPGIFQLCSTTVYGNENLIVWLEGIESKNTSGNILGREIFDINNYPSAESGGKHGGEHDSHTDRIAGECPICRAITSDNDRLVCIECQASYHITCLDLEEHPAINWACRRCATRSSTDGDKFAIRDTEIASPSRQKEERPTHLLSCLSRPVDIEFVDDCPEPQAVAAGRQWISWTKSGHAFYIGCCRDPVLVPTLYNTSSKPTHELVPGNFHLDFFDGDNALDHLRLQHGIAQPEHEQLRKHIRPGNLAPRISLTKAIANSISAHG